MAVEGQFGEYDSSYDKQYASLLKNQTLSLVLSVCVVYVCFQLPIQLKNKRGSETGARFNK